MDIRSGTESVTFKAIVVGAIVLLLMVPLAFLRDLVSERAGLREEAYRACRGRLGRQRDDRRSDGRHPDRAHA